MKFNKILYLFALVLMTVSMTSCSETEEESTEFDNWQNRNEAFFTARYNEAKENIANGDTSWKIIRCFSMPLDNSEFSYTEKPEDCIVVHVEKEGKSTSDSPLYTDYALLHYCGNLMPSASYPNGYQFDASYEGTFYPETTKPSNLGVSAVVDGFSTALQNMHIGDEWKVYIPYQLGYGETAQTSIPAYSTLIFDITLVEYYRADADAPTLQ